PAIDPALPPVLPPALPAFGSPSCMFSVCSPTSSVIPSSRRSFYIVYANSKYLILKDIIFRVLTNILASNRERFSSGQALIARAYRPGPVDSRFAGRRAMGAVGRGTVG